jgi:hypothetical protein
MSSGFPIPGLCRQCKLNPSRKFTTYVDRSNPDGMVQDSTVPVYAEVRRKISTIFIYIYISVIACSDTMTLLLEMSSFANLRYKFTVSWFRTGPRYRKFSFGVSLDETIFGALS